MALEQDLLAPSRSVRPAPVYRIAPGLSWSAILAGAAVSLALSFLLTVLAAGFGMQFGGYGLSSRASLAGFTPVVGAWAIVAQLLPAALGGYLAGRLRHGWHEVHDDESHFRDTAHGLITWAVATLVGVVFVALLLSPYAEHMGGTDAAAAAKASLSSAQVERAANISAQAAYFAAVGLLLSAFVAAVGTFRNVISTKKLTKRARLKPGPPCADASASCTPNQTSMIVARAMHIRRPIAVMEGAAVEANWSHPCVMKFSSPIRQPPRYCG